MNALKHALHIALPVVVTLAVLKYAKAGTFGTTAASVANAVS